MSQHKELFQQQNLQRERAEVDKVSGQPLIEFESSFGRCATRIEHVREVIATPEVVAYPENHEGHLGVVNVRGQIIPVVGRTSESRPDRNGVGEGLSDRLIIFEFTAGRSFAIAVTRVHKIVCDATLASGRVLNLAGSPARYVDSEEFFFERGAVA